MNVLSLFDGMSCGQIALQKLGVQVDNYFASEIDKPAITVTKSNFPNTQHLGDVTEVKGSDLPKIDLLLAGSPCQGFSFIGKQLNFEDERSKLFFEFVRLLKETKPKFFLLENVVMKEEFQKIISEALGVQPVLINSKILSPQQRPRLYWTNIPVAEIEPSKTQIEDILEKCDKPNTDAWHKYFERKGKMLLGKHYLRIFPSKHFNKAVCITARMPGNWNGNLVKLPNNKYRFFTPLECERLQTVPDNYTRAVAKSHRYKMLGNGWTVDVIAHILEPLALL